ncbi:MAG: hypothetical protein JKX79_04010, partial [Labilibaculum sp.]|nr:hypothetical protein [Labilibaculum sp.]
MKSLLKLLMVFVGVLLITNTQAQNNGTTPYAGSTHAYTITKSSIAGTTLAWTVTSGTAGTEYNFVGATNGATADVEWLLAGTYILQVVETRTDVTAACPTTRQISVTVTANTFDVYAELVTTADACATVLNPVDDVNANGSNGDDVFGTTTREFKVKMQNGDITKSWSFDYALTDIATDFDLSDVTAVSITGGVATVNNVLVAAGTTEVAFSISYSTNKNTTGINGQDLDFDLILTVSGAEDQLGTPDSDTADSSNKATYSVRAVPATTGITT